MAKDSLRKFLSGQRKTLELGGTPPTQAVENLRKLDAMGVLSEDMVWKMLEQTTVDPLFLISFIRQNKSKMGFHEEEHLLNDSVYFLAGNKCPLGHEISYAVDIFTNDVSLLVYTADANSYRLLKFISAEDMFRAMSAFTVGSSRVLGLSNIISGHLEDAKQELNRHRQTS